MPFKASVYIASSLDGYIARNDGELDWITGHENGDADEDFGYKNFMDSIDVIVMGRNTYEKILSFDFWPYSDKHVVVLSSGNPEIPVALRKGITIKNDPPKKIVESLSKEGFEHGYIDGGITIQSFLNAGLLDELIITRIPVLIGSGVPMFGELKQDIHLNHVKTTTFSNGFVQHHYRVKN